MRLGLTRFKLRLGLKCVELRDISILRQMAYPPPSPHLVKKCLIFAISYQQLGEDFNFDSFYAQDLEMSM